MDATPGAPQAVGVEFFCREVLFIPLFFFSLHVVDIGRLPDGLRGKSGIRMPPPRPPSVYHAPADDEFLIGHVIGAVDFTAVAQLHQASNDTLSGHLDTLGAVFMF